MKAKGLFVFWMVEHEYYLRGKFKMQNSFKSEKLQVNIIA